MPASRPIWKGQLRLSLVSIAVELYTATKSNAKPSFRQIHEPSGKPVRELYDRRTPADAVFNVLENPCESTLFASCVYTHAKC